MRGLSRRRNVCPFVCPSVCLAQSSTVSKRINVSLIYQGHVVTHSSSFWEYQDFFKIQVGLPPKGASNKVGVG